MFPKNLLLLLLIVTLNCI